MHGGMAPVKVTSAMPIFEFVAANRRPGRMPSGFHQKWREA
jgi:hypothetical protein